MRGGEVVQVHGGHIIRSTAGKKDRHSKVYTAKGARDRRVRLAAHTAIQFYDVQDRLGFDRPSKAVDWLLEKAKHAIDKLERLPPFDSNDSGQALPETGYPHQPENGFPAGVGGGWGPEMGRFSRLLTSDQSLVRPMWDDLHVGSTRDQHLPMQEERIGILGSNRFLEFCNQVEIGGGEEMVHGMMVAAHHHRGASSRSTTTDSSH